MSQAKRVDYDQIASTYDQRYVANERSGTAAALLACARACYPCETDAPCILEVGCGTGRWLADLAAVTAQVYGLDLSAGMLRGARKREAALYLARGRAEELPFPSTAFDLVYCVNAIHHFDRPRAFVSEARRLLRPGGRLAVVGMDPHGRRDSWYVYRYFDGTYETDLRRFPPWETTIDWLTAEGFEQVECRIVEHFSDAKVGQAVLDDPFVQKHACSQLALLSEEAYDAGLRRIRAALAQAEAAGETLIFAVDTPLAMITGQLGGP